jgi:hypothetical protein
MSMSVDSTKQKTLLILSPQSAAVLSQKDDSFLPQSFVNIGWLALKNKDGMQDYCIGSKADCSYGGG